jgi:hypothetical protein
LRSPNAPDFFYNVVLHHASPKLSEAQAKVEVEVEVEVEREFLAFTTTLTFAAFFSPPRVAFWAMASAVGC